MMDVSTLTGMLGWGYHSSRFGRLYCSTFGRMGTFSSFGGQVVSGPPLSNHWAFNSAPNYSRWGDAWDPFDFDYDEYMAGVYQL